MPDNDFQTIKERLDLLQVITQDTELQMKKKHLEKCPFCGGKECFSIDQNKQLYKCFQCPAAGDVITFLQEYHNLPNKAEALQAAAERAGVQLTTKGPKKPKEIAALNLTVKETIYLEAARYYHAQMHLDGGMPYMTEQRGHKIEALDRMVVGWTTGCLVEHLIGKNFTHEQIKASWLGRELKHGESLLLVDRYPKGWAIFPHFYKGKVIHFTHKDPEKKEGSDFQLPSDYRDKGWTCYNQEALDKYSEAIVVEGENDLLSVMDAGMENVVAIIGNPSEHQIKVLKKYCGAGKHLYLWLDNDETPDKPHEKGKGFIRRICKELAAQHQNVHVIVYDDFHKDPDEYLRAFEGDRKREIKRLQQEALDYVSWEIVQIAKIEETTEKQLRALKDREIFARVVGMMETEKAIYVEKMTLQLGILPGVIEEQLEINQDLKRTLKDYFLAVLAKDVDPNYVAFKIFQHFSKDGRFFRDAMSDVYLLLNHHIYMIGNNRPFNALIKKHTNLLPTKEPGRSVWESLASEAYNMGMRIDLASWIATDRANDTVFVNLNSRDNSIIKIGKKNIEEVPNGINKEGMLLKSSDMIRPVNYLPDCDIREGMQALKNLVLGNLTCEPELGYQIILWLFSAFLLDFCPYMALMKFSGATASGKTTAAKLVSVLIYGTEELGDPTGAAAYADAAQNPLLVIDNLESGDMTKQIEKFLLLSATKGGKVKRIQGKDSGTIREKPRALVLITAIEPFTKAEHINRTYDIEFSLKYKKDDFIEDEVIRELVKKRDLIISSILKFIARDVLPELEKRREYITILKKQHRNHAKNRTDEYLALLMLMLGHVLKYIPFYDENHILYGVETGEKETYTRWIEYQDQKAKETETSSNNIIKLLDGMVREYMLKMKELDRDALWQWNEELQAEVVTYVHPEYGIEIAKTKPVTCEDETTREPYTRLYVEFVTTSKDLVLAFGRYCKNNGEPNPYRSESVFASRLRNDTPLLEKSGWQLITKHGKPWKQGMEPYYKVLEGQRFRKFRKVIIR